MIGLKKRGRKIVQTACSTLTVRHSEHAGLSNLGDDVGRKVTGENKAWKNAAVTAAATATATVSLFFLSLFHRWRRVPGKVKHQISRYRGASVFYPSIKKIYSNLYVVAQS